MPARYLVECILLLQKKEREIIASVAKMCHLQEILWTEQEIIVNHNCFLCVDTVLCDLGIYEVP